MSQRGTYQFEVDDKGLLAANDGNLDRLQRLFKDGSIIAEQWGPGNDGDFDNGSWHILCHLAGGSGVFATSSGYAWATISHDPAGDRYEATLIVKENGASKLLPLVGPVARSLLTSSPLRGFVEGSSQGHVMARDAADSNAFNGWRRQDFDQAVTSDDDGGTVWEHWCTTRDIRPSSAMGTSVLRAYLELVSVLGGRFVGAVARGRREHQHPAQLRGLVKAGLLTADEAAWDTTPLAIPAPAQALLYEARPAEWLGAAQLLPYDVARGPSYFMFARRIDRWSKTGEVRADMRGL